MATLPVGILIVLTALLASTPLKSWATFFNVHSMVIVIGGTIGILAFSTPFKVLQTLWGDLQALWQREPDIGDNLAEFEQLAENRHAPVHSKNPLIQYAVELWDNGTTPEIFQVLISQRKEKIESHSAEAVQALRHLAKYPPALGMTGTVMGLVGLFLNLNAENRSGLGPALGLALTATFFGLIVANGVVMPLADRLAVRHMCHKAYMQ